MANILSHMSKADRQLVVRTVRGARQVLKSQKAWTKNAFALTSDKWSVPVTDAKACKFCIRGAVMSVAHKILGESKSAHYNKITGAADAVIKQALSIKTKKNWSIEDWNDVDRRTHGEVVDLLNRSVDRVVNLAKTA